MAGRSLAGSAQSVASGGRNSWPCERTGPPLSRLLPGGMGQKAAARLLEAPRAAAGRGGRSTAGRNTANEARTQSDGWMRYVRHTVLPFGFCWLRLLAQGAESPASLHKGFCLPWGYLLQDFPDAIVPLALQSVHCLQHRRKQRAEASAGTQSCDGTSEQGRSEISPG